METFVVRGTTSCSSETRAVMSLSLVNLRLLMPSKHLMRCFWIFLGFFVLEYIWRSSSLDRK